MGLDGVISHIADTGGCSFYRMRMPAWAAQAINRGLHVTESHKYINIPDFYKDIKLVRLQRQVSGAQCEYFHKFLKPLSNQIGFWINYEVDDVIGKDDIPKYNSGWQAYQDPSFYNFISSMMCNSDFLTVTSEELGNYYNKKFNVPKSNILVIPNYIPKWWMAGLYNIDKIEKRYKDIKNRKPRICFPASTTHYDIFYKTDGVDDFTHVVDFVRSTVDKYEWIFVGGVPKQLKDLVNNNKIIFIPGYDLFNYPREVAALNPDLIVAPLQNNVFNRCKSNIKFSEFSAIGIPGIFQDLVTYNKYTKSLFNDSNDLQNQIDSILSNKENYLDLVKHNRDIVENGDSNSPNGWWLENNMQKWNELFNIAQRSLSVDLTNEITKRENGGILPPPPPVKTISI